MRRFFPLACLYLVIVGMVSGIFYGLTFVVPGMFDALFSDIDLGNTYQFGDAGPLTKIGITTHYGFSILQRLRASVVLAFLTVNTLAAIFASSTLVLLILRDQLRVRRTKATDF